MDSTEKWFRCPCPIVDCKNKAKDVAFDWIHRNCYGKMKVSSRGYLQCTKCYKKGDIIDWKFKCEEHDYEALSYQGITLAVSTMCQIEDIDDDWLEEVTDKLKIQRKRLS